MRQVVGWRESVWGTSWLRHDRWPDDDALGARRPLPAAYAEAGRHETERNGLDRVLGQVGEHGYAHHIERLMVLGNVLLLAGVRPRAAVRWFQSAFLDGAERVMAPTQRGCRSTPTAGRS